MGDESSAGIPFWEQPEWWAARGDAAVSRRVLIRRWTERTDLDGLDSSRFEDALNAWASKLAQQEWVRAALGATAVMYASQGVNNVYPGSGDWQRVSRLLGAYGDPLARYVVGFVPEVHNYRPAVSKLQRSAVREAARSVTKDVREAMIADGVIASRASLTAFLGDPDRRRRRDLELAAAVYAGNLCKHANRVGDPELSHAVTVALAGLQRELGIPVPTVELAPAEKGSNHNVEARELFWASMTGVEGRSDEFFDKSAQRAISAIEKKLAQGEGVSVADARIIYYVKKRSLAQEDLRPRSLIQTPTETDILEGSRGAAPPSEHLSIEQSAVLGRAASFLKDIRIAPWRSRRSESAPITAFWEKDVATDIVSGLTDLGRGSSTIKQVVAEQWTAQGGEPATAVCPNLGHAAGFVTGLVRIALAHALSDIEDFPEWVGRTPQTERWADRLRAVAAMLERYRGMDPQDVYDNPKKGDLA
ncbi:hypothetical protein L2K20_20605 [Mycobacterium sp. MBM]|nr:hypothetical protein [Mycobacterium sp. MBM]